MKLKKLLIAGGNSTLLVWGNLPQEKEKIIKKYLGQVEQIGFVSSQNYLPKLTMMGNELSINGTLALASQYNKKGDLYTSGLNRPISYQNKNGTTSITLSISFKQINNIVLLSGIGYCYFENEKEISKQLLKKLAKKYKLPAFGGLLYKENKLTPFVYVQGTNSLIAETACGSGSIAISILTGTKNIIQPTGEIITVKRNKNQFTVSANVDTINL